MVQVFDVTPRTHRDLYARRPGSAVGTVLHSTDGSNSLGWLQGGSILAGHAASSDALVDRGGDIYIIVPFTAHSWHAGISRNETLKLRDAANSIWCVGLEVECADSKGEQWTLDQHVAAALYHRNKARAFGYSLEHCWGHYQIARPLGRRSDPSGINWGLFWSLVYSPTAIMLEFERGNQ